MKVCKIDFKKEYMEIPDASREYKIARHDGTLATTMVSDTSIPDGTMISASYDVYQVRRIEGGSINEKDSVVLVKTGDDGLLDGFISIDNNQLDFLRAEAEHRASSKATRDERKRVMALPFYKRLFNNLK